jgi:putative oxidoreductase
MDYLPTTDDFNLAVLLLRVVVGPTIAFHGYAKIFRGGRLRGTAGWFESIGMKPGDLHARFAAGGELLTGACITLGLLTSFAGLGLVGLMTVAFWTVHRGHGLLVFANGWEYNLVLGAIGVTLSMLGAGRWSLDNAFGIDLNGGVGLAISLVGGVGVAALLLATSFHRPIPEAAADTEAEAAEVDAEA